MKILFHFGKFIVGKMVIKTTTDLDAVKIWSLLHHCTALNKLKLVGVNVNCLRIYQRVKRVLQNLTNLTFENCPGSNWKHACVINACKKLQHLTVFNGMHGTSDKLLTYIARESSNLERIWLGMRDTTNEIAFVENMIKLQHVKKLKNLIINCHNYRIGPAIDALVTKDLLQKLMLVSVVPDERFSVALSNFSNLTFVFSTEQQIPDGVKRSLENVTIAEEVMAAGYVHRGKIQRFTH